MWRDFIVQSIVPGVKRKRSIYPAHDDPGDGTPPPPGKPSAGGGAGVLAAMVGASSAHDWRGSGDLPMRCTHGGG